LGERLMAFIRDEARKHSSELAKGRGRFPNWERSVFARDNVAMRNATTTTIAPTGSISIIAGCSSGIEPFYAIAFERNVLDGAKLIESNLIFEQMARDWGFYSEELMTRVAAVRSISDIEEIPESLRKLFVTAADIPAEDHIRMQAAFQKQVDSSVSKTINFPETADRGDVAKAFQLAFETGCKGCTIYRDNSRPGQVLSTGRRVAEASAIKRPRSLPGFTDKIRTGYGNLYVTVTVQDGLPFEVFAQIGKSGFTTMADTEAICRLISLALRSGVRIEQIIRQLRGIGGSSQVFAEGSRVFSIPDAIAQVLSRHFSPRETDGDASTQGGEVCPECEQVMVFEAGCFNCQSCGYSNC
jgi:ribonucleoside-diphosphate reductase alpha chain